MLAYAREQRAAGRSWTWIAGRVGLSAGSLKNWSRTPPPARALIPVEVAATAPLPPGLVIVSPGGYRVEGLDLATTSALLRTLG